MAAVFPPCFGDLGSPQQVPDQNGVLLGRRGGGGDGEFEVCSLRCFFPENFTERSSVCVKSR